MPNDCVCDNAVHLGQPSSTFSASPRENDLTAARRWFGFRSGGRSSSFES
jgi:hypothetical protein